MLLSNEIYFKEFKPINKNDILIEILRDIFISSFDDYYSSITFYLHLPSNITTKEWLNTVFDQIIDNLISQKSYCYLLTIGPLASDTRGIVIFRHDSLNNIIFVQQCVMHPRFKRHGFGRIAFEKFLSLFPKNSIYRGVCRRINRPALLFYTHLGIQLLDDEDIVIKCDYDPLDYIALQYSNGVLA